MYLTSLDLSYLSLDLYFSTYLPSRVDLYSRYLSPFVNLSSNLAAPVFLLTSLDLLLIFLVFLSLFLYLDLSYFFLMSLSERLRYLSSPLSRYFFFFLF